ncbi:MAG: peptidase M50, partial [Methylocystaceae bacterium]
QMRWSLTIGSFMGTAVRIHVTFLLLLGWIGFAAYQRGGAVAARDSLLFIVAIFVCVVLHEFGHIFMARRYGIVSPVITLLPIGGVADMESMPDKPRQELLIALAGPAVNLVIAALLILFLGAVDFSDAIQIGDPSVNLLKRLAAVNIFLAAFNLIPAFPMDGGRVLRAALSIWIGKGRATRIAAQIGQGFAFLLGFLGLFGNPLLLFIAIFVYIAAAGEAQMTSMSEAARPRRDRTQRKRARSGGYPSGHVSGRIPSRGRLAPAQRLPVPRQHHRSLAGCRTRRADRAFRSPGAGDDRWSREHRRRPAHAHERRGGRRNRRGWAVLGSSDPSVAG